MSINSTAIDVKDKFVSGSIGIFPPDTTDKATYGISITKEMDRPDRMITLADTGGPQPDHVFDRTIAPMETKTFSCRVRGLRNGDYEKDVYAKCEEIVTFLETLARFTIAPEDSADPPIKYFWIRRVGDIVFLDQDTNDRYIFTINFQAKRQRR